LLFQRNCQTSHEIVVKSSVFNGSYKVRMPFNRAVKLAVEDSNDSTDTHSLGWLAPLVLLLLFLYLRGFLMDLLYVKVRQKEVLWLPIVWVCFPVVPRAWT